MPEWNSVAIDCKVCGEVFYATPSRLRRFSVAFCSRRCQGLARRSPDRKLTDHGYVMVRVPDHPRPSGTGGWVYEHILVMEAHLGRLLRDKEEVHHDNEIKSDNRIENLILCQDHAEHALLHAQKRIIEAGGNPDFRKFCSRCKKLKYRADFGRGDMKSHSDGLRGYCHSCEAEYARERRLLRHAS